MAKIGRDVTDTQPRFDFDRWRAAEPTGRRPSKLLVRPTIFFMNCRRVAPSQNNRAGCYKPRRAGSTAIARRQTMASYTIPDPSSHSKLLHTSARTEPLLTSARRCGNHYRNHPAPRIIPKAMRSAAHQLSAHDNKRRILQLPQLARRCPNWYGAANRGYKSYLMRAPALEKVSPHSGFGPNYSSLGPIRHLVNICDNSGHFLQSPQATGQILQCSTNLVGKSGRR